MKLSEIAVKVFEPPARPTANDLFRTFKDLGDDLASKGFSQLKTKLIPDRRFSSMTLQIEAGNPRCQNLLRWEVFGGNQEQNACLVKKTASGPKYLAESHGPTSKTIDGLAADILLGIKTITREDPRQTEILAAIQSYLESVEGTGKTEQVPSSAALQNGR